LPLGINCDKTLKAFIYKEFKSQKLSLSIPSAKFIKYEFGKFWGLKLQVGGHSSEFGKILAKEIFTNESV